MTEIIATEVLRLYVDTNHARHNEGIKAARVAVKQASTSVRERAGEMKQEQSTKSKKKGAPSAIKYALDTDGVLTRYQKPMGFAIKGLWEIQAQLGVECQHLYDLALYSEEVYDAGY